MSQTPANQRVSGDQAKGHGCFGINTWNHCSRREGRVRCATEQQFDSSGFDRKQRSGIELLGLKKKKKTVSKNTTRIFDAFAAKKMYTTYTSSKKCAYRYEGALRRHIRAQYAVLAGITTAERPSWWLPGNGFVEEPIVPAALDAAMVPSLEHLGEIPDGAVVNCAGDDDAAVPKRRRKKEFVSDFLKTWFVQYSQLPR